MQRFLKIFEKLNLNWKWRRYWVKKQINKVKEKLVYQNILIKPIQKIKNVIFKYW